MYAILRLRLSLFVNRLNVQFNTHSKIYRTQVSESFDLHVGTTPRHKKTSTHKRILAVYVGDFRFERHLLNFVFIRRLDRCDNNNENGKRTPMSFVYGVVYDSSFTGINCHVNYY